MPKNIYWMGAWPPKNIAVYKKCGRKNVVAISWCNTRNDITAENDCMYLQCAPSNQTLGFLFFFVALLALLHGSCIGKPNNRTFNKTCCKILGLTLCGMLYVFFD